MYIEIGVMFELDTNQTMKPYNNILLRFEICMDTSTNQDNALLIYS